LRGIDGFARADLVEDYLFPLQSWVEGKRKSPEGKVNKLFNQIHDLLGVHDDTKIFLASILVSLLRAQQLRARRIADSNLKKIKTENGVVS
jgi:hypothetical protein